MNPETGQMFGPYEILGRLGSGGMGTVFRAWDERLHREVAIKLVRDGYRVPGTRERFLQEARAASRLNNPNICTIFDIGEKDGDPYLVMELLEGETLKEKIGRGALSIEEILIHSREISDALAAAHDRHAAGTVAQADRRIGGVDRLPAGTRGVERLHVAAAHH